MKILIGMLVSFFGFEIYENAIFVGLAKLASIFLGLKKMPLFFLVH